ncbi:LytR/AlgR family response regulator transcription factor [Peribacillus sp. B-H-3]|uniref:LytR/AlgR family response regulator transcription factor n=1 Tax=Peribacillus sp. B-H-3 TaxID=3400420 RepID=UPI003B01B06E
MDKLRIVISDDDQTSRTLLQHFIELFPDFVITGEVSTGEELVQSIMKTTPDLILVDINMPGMSGMEAVKVCKQFMPDLNVIFTTGFDEFAVEAFALSAIDYLVKPIEISRLGTALEKAKKIIRFQKETEKKQSGNVVKKLTLKTGNSYLYLPLDDILFIERGGRKSIIHTVATSYETGDSLQIIGSNLPPYFLKTHRSFLVNLKKIINIQTIGESFNAHFSESNKTAQISKLKFNEVQEIISNLPI